MPPGRVVVTLKVELPTYSVKEALNKQAPKMVSLIEDMNEDPVREVGRPKREPPKVKSVSVTR